MSFTGSFSHRQKSSQEQDSQASQNSVGLSAVQQKSVLLTCCRMQALSTITASRTLDQKPLRSRSQNPYPRTVKIFTLRNSTQTMGKLLQA